MKKIVYSYSSNKLVFESLFVYETEHSYIIDYYVNCSGSLVGKSYFRRPSKIKDVLDYWKGDDYNITRILLEEFFGNGYRNNVRKVF